MGLMNQFNWRHFLLLLIIIASSVLITVPTGATTTTENISITQTPNDTVVESGDTVTFVVKLYVPQEYNGPAVDVDLPAGWEITSQSSAPSGRYKEGSNQWIWLNSGNKTVEYSVKVPETNLKSSYRIVTDGLGVDQETNSVESDTAVSLIEVNQSTTNVTPSQTTEQPSSLPSTTGELATTQDTVSSSERSNRSQSPGQTGFGVFTIIVSAVVLTLFAVMMRSIR